LPTSDSVQEGEGTDYFFPPPPFVGAFEWKAEGPGPSATITKMKGRTASKDKSLHKQLEKYSRIRQKAADFISKMRDSMRTGDAIIHGIGARVLTNSEHLYDFWTENWFSREEWQVRTGEIHEEEPRVLIYALIGVEGEDASAFYNRSTNEIFFFNTSYYGQLKSWTLGAVGRILAEEYGIHSIHGACVAIDGRGILYIAPTGTGKTTSSYGLTLDPDARFHSDDWVYVRYAYRRKSDGKYIAPYRVTNRDGESISGYRVFRWIAENWRDNGDANVQAIGLQNTEVSEKLADLGVSDSPEAFAYISEKKFYLRTNIVESFPYALPEMVHSKTENVPMITDRYQQRSSAAVESMMCDLLVSEDPTVQETIEKMRFGELRQKAARLIVFGNARAIFSQSHAFMPHKVIIDPLEPVRIEMAVLIKRDLNSEEVMVELDREKFVERLLKGETPDGRWEIAYNDYRAADDDEEKEYLKNIFERAETRNSKVTDEFDLDRQKRPYTLDQEFELFDLLFKATKCYDLNTILQRTGISKRDAVAMTIDLIRKAFSGWRVGARLKLEDLGKRRQANNLLHQRSDQF